MTTTNNTTTKTAAKTPTMINEPLSVTVTPETAPKLDFALGGKADATVAELRAELLETQRAVFHLIKMASSLGQGTLTKEDFAITNDEIIPVLLGSVPSEHTLMRNISATTLN